MNIENIKKAMEYIKIIPAEKFDMHSFRDSMEVTQECGTVGCIVGWCTILDTSANFKRFIVDDGDDEPYIDYKVWSYDFFGLSTVANIGLPNYDIYSVFETQNIWNYLFSSWWGDNPETNTIDHAIYRFKRLLNDPYYIKKSNFSDLYSYECQKLNIKNNYF